MGQFKTVWTFETARFAVELAIAYDRGFKYDGDDPQGEMQAALDSGAYVAFDSRVRVLLDGRTVAEEHLGASVYATDEVRDFWTAHRDRNPMNRNGSIMRAAHPAGPKVSICHYFPGMVCEAIAEVRKTFPVLRAA